jgi:hypothetical protein
MVASTRSAAVYSYDPVANTWALDSALLVARDMLGVAMGSDRRLYAIGGYDGSTQALSTVDAYTPGSPWVP